MPLINGKRDAQGKPLDPTKLYTPISPHARGWRVYNPGETELRGDHEDVTGGATQLWIRVDAGSDEKRAARVAHIRAAAANIPPPVPDPYMERMNRPPRKIPLERLVFATDTFSKGALYAERGARRDIDDEIVKAAPEMFQVADDSPVLGRPDLFDPEAA